MIAIQYGFNFDKNKMSLSKNPTPILVEKQTINIVVKPIVNENFGLDIMYVTEKSIGKVIGVNGRNIKSIRKLSKAEIDIENSVNKSANRQITIMGTESQIKTAINLINKT